MNETPVDITRKYSQGLVYPASKDQVLEVLERNGAPAHAVEIIRATSHPKYASPGELLNRLREA